MTDNEKMLLPLKILSDLSLNAGTIDIEELMKDKSEEDKEYIKEVVEDLENAGYIEINVITIHLLKTRFSSKW